MKRRAVVAAIIIFFAAPLFARAGHLDVADAPDVSGLLDIESVEVDGFEEATFLIKTYKGWSEKRIMDKGFFFVYFDTFAGARSDYFVLVLSDGLDIDALLMRDRSRKPDRKIARLAVAHNSRDDVVVIVPIEKMRVGAGRISYSWYTTSVFTNKTCPKVCIDRAPDEGAITEPLVVAPTPSESPSESPSPSPSASASPGS